MQGIYAVGDGSACSGSAAIEAAARVLNGGGLALLPTETVYGLAASVAAFSAVARDAASITPDASSVSNASATAAECVLPYPVDPSVIHNGSAVPAEGTGYRRIFSLKQRNITQTVAWLVASADDLDRYGVDIAPEAHVLGRAFWPGALTIVVKAAPCVPAFMQEVDGTIALRVSASPVIAAIIDACKSPLACTSANTHGMPAPASFDNVEPRVLDGVDIAIDAGTTPDREASTIVSFQHGSLEIIRQGALSAEAIKRVLEEQK